MRRPWLLFLDIDGVLNDQGSYSTPCQSRTIRPACVEGFNRLLREGDWGIVVSSAWRYMVHGGAMTLRGFEYLLRTHGVECHGRVEGLTAADEAVPTRGLQIRDWLNEHGDRRPYLVLDDNDDDITGQGHPLVRTHPDHGFREADRLAALDYLRRPPFTAQTEDGR